MCTNSFKIELGICSLIEEGRPYPMNDSCLPTLAPSPSLPTLFISFLRMGITAFGGPAMILYMREMAVEKKNWLDGETFKEGVALCQAIPGATGMQMVAYIGLQTRGVPGAVVSFIGFGLSAFILMTALSVLYARTQEMPAVTSVFNGLRAIIVAVVAHAAWSFGKNTLKNMELCKASTLFG